MKKGQIKNIFNYILVIIVAGFILYFGFTQIARLTSSVNQGELISFVNTLENNLEAQRASASNRAGSIKEEVFFLPAGVESVCFVDETKGYNTLVNPELNNMMEIYEDYNVYFNPDDIIPVGIEHLEIEEGNNPLCVKPIDGKLNLKLTSRKGKTEVSAAELNRVDINCVLANGVSDPSNKVDIVFLGYAYGDKDQFRSDVDGYIHDVFLSVEPFSSNQDKFTFYLIDTFEDLDCSFVNWIDCDDFKVKQLASNCPNDYTIVLAERNWIANLFSPIRSSAFSNVQQINTADNPNVVMHEFGHIFGKLADEYVDDDYYDAVDFMEEDYPNCDSAGCEEWNNVPGCFEGCSLSDYFRPTDNSIMRNLNQNYFGPVNEQIIMEKLDAYGGTR